jgi:secreted trypsin-like serine protease
MRGLILLFVLCAVAQAAINQNGCGKRPLRPNPPNKVVGGNIVPVKGDYGWMTGMYRSGSFICGGSLIDPNWVLSAAHCTAGSANVNNYQMYIGFHDRLSMESWTIQRGVSKIIQHAQYSASTLRNDIVLLKLAQPCPIDNNYILPACIPDGSESWVGKIGTATGWGTLFSGGGLPRELYEVGMPHLTDARCTQRFNTDPNTQMCGGEVGFGLDTCQGDSGGPYVFKSARDGNYYLVGLTSWGYGCGDGGVYTKTAGYFNWINSNVNTQ